MRIVDTPLSRRRFLTSSATGLLGAAGTFGMPGLSRAADRPAATSGIQSGDVQHGSAVFWSRTDRPANALFEWSTTTSFKTVNRLPAVAALPETDYAVKIMARGLPADQEIFYRVRFQDLADIHVESEPVVGHLRSAPAGLRDVSFVWSGDTVGQGWASTSIAAA